MSTVSAESFRGDPGEAAAKTHLCSELRETLQAFVCPCFSAVAVPLLPIALSFPERAFEHRRVPLLQTCTVVARCRRGVKFCLVLAQRAPTQRKVSSINELPFDVAHSTPRQSLQQKGPVPQFRRAHVTRLLAVYPKTCREEQRYNVCVFSQLTAALVQARTD